MEYQKAQEIVTNNQHLIGKTIKGGIIDELVIHPTEQESYDNFVTSYIQSGNANLSIQPYRNQDVNVFAIIEKGRINAQGIFLHASLDSISTEHEINL
ncbi:hypothetical protein [Flavobacterium inviolabile]|uniref:hypothetical protein n=1 Tax=Flavobacterium inviolabile TaxID=2748320 RepID=UPI0015A8BCCF|nr:hypothetical protein [Flavobacterium inviolabile]